MTTTYNYNGIEYDERSSFPGRNETTKASLWWGEPMLARYSIALTNDMHFASESFFKGFQNANIINRPPIYQGNIFFAKRKTTVPSVQDIKALDIFQVSCFFVTFSSNGVSPAIYFCDTNEMEKLSRANESDSYRPLPGIWISADMLAGQTLDLTFSTTLSSGRSPRAAMKLSEIVIILGATISESMGRLG
jgi:hypothetical protein